MHTSNLDVIFYWLSEKSVLKYLADDTEISVVSKENINKQISITEFSSQYKLILIINFHET